MDGIANIPDSKTELSRNVREQPLLLRGGGFTIYLTVEAGTYSLFYGEGTYGDLELELLPVEVAIPGKIFHTPCGSLLISDGKPPKWRHLGKLNSSHEEQLIENDPSEYGIEEHPERVVLVCK